MMIGLLSSALAPTAFHLRAVCAGAGTLPRKLGLIDSVMLDATFGDAPEEESAPSDELSAPEDEQLSMAKESMMMKKATPEAVDTFSAADDGYSMSETATIQVSSVHLLSSNNLTATSYMYNRHRRCHGQ